MSGEPWSPINEEGQRHLAERLERERLAAGPPPPTWEERANALLGTLKKIAAVEIHAIPDNKDVWRRRAQKMHNIARQAIIDYDAQTT